MEQFWAYHEEVINSYSQLVDTFDRIHSKWNDRNKIFAWRGQSDSSWPLHSSLFRRLAWTRGALNFDERDLYRKEGNILADVHRWGLHMSPLAGRLSVLNQLAALQHYGAPTRLIDVTFNPWIGSWFAVEEKLENGKLAETDTDARLFAIDITSRLINEDDQLRHWEDCLKRPWHGDPSSDAPQEHKDLRKQWSSQVYAWKPSHFDGRIAAQNGGFIFGGVPTTTSLHGQNQWPKGDQSGHWRIDEVRAATSLALRPHKLKTIKGGVSSNAVYSFRISVEAKKEIRERLQRQFGYKHSTIYPDFSGFAQFHNFGLNEKP